jgi:hypothetical protein
VRPHRFLPVLKKGWGGVKSRPISFLKGTAMNLVQLRNHLLAQLGVLGVGGAAAAEDAVFAEAVLGHAQSELEQLGVALWTLDDVPEHAVEALVRYALPLAAPRFGKSDEFPLADLALTLARLRELTSDGRTGVGTAEYF